MKKTIFVLLLLSLVYILHAQGVSSLETQADEWALKSYTQSKAISAYLQCFRQAEDRGTKLKLMEKTTAVIANRTSLLSKDAIVIDSLIDEARPTFGKDTKCYLPLLEQRLLKAPYSSNKYQLEFLLYDEIKALISANNLNHGERYENLLRWYVGKSVYKKDLSKEDKLAVYDELWDVYRTNSPGIDSLDVKLLDNYAIQCSLCKQSKTSVQLHELKKEYIIKTYGKNSDEYLKILHTLYLDYYQLYSDSHSITDTRITEEKQKSIDYQIEWYQLMKENGKDIESANVRSIVHDLITYKKDTLPARSIASEYATSIENSHGNENADYCDALSIVIDTYERTDAKAIPLLEELLSLQEKVWGKDDLHYKATDSQLTLALSHNHRMGEAIDRQKNTTQTENIISLMTLSSQQAQYGAYRDAIETYNQMMEYCATHPQDKALYLISACLGPINCYNKLRDTDGLLNFSRRWSNDNRFTAEEQTYLFSSVISAAAQPQNVNSQVPLYVDEFLLSHPTIMTSPVERAAILEQKANAYMGLLQFREAEDIIRSITTSLYAEKADIITQIKYEQDLEICLLAQERWEEALAQNQLVLSHMSQLPNYTNFYEYRALCCRAAMYQDQKKNYDEVLRLCSIIDHYDVGTAIPMDVNATFSFNTFSILCGYAIDASFVEQYRFRALYKKNLKTEARFELTNLIDNKMHLLRFALSQMDHSTLQSSFIWTQDFNNTIINAALLANTDSLSIHAYNYTLLYKEAFLTTESLMRNQLLESPDENIQSKFKELQNLRTTIQQYEAAHIPTQALNERRIQLEKQLVEDSKMYGDFTRSLNYTWDSIRKHLKPDDMAVEFVGYNSFEDGKNHIAALLIRPQWTSPKLLHLFSEEQIPAKIYDDNTFAQMCWTPILQQAKGVKNIYFAPSGALYNINIESLLSPQGTNYLADNYHIYRLSSTRQLVSHQKTKRTSSAVIYGGIDYSAESYNAKDIKPQNATDNKSDLRAVIGGIQYLPGSKKEAEAIVDILRTSKKDLKLQLLTGSAATETSFKKISGQEIDIIHISTHGFYNNSSMNNHKNKSSFYITQVDMEDRSLTHSGLLFAGAEDILYMQDQQQKDEDGVLTALEISTMDLRNLEMTVLSACQTAQGDIMSDGVFGLQRGFKKAGANSILMSLWPVNDEATCFLMTEFYRNWIEKGYSKHDALELAKKSVRSHTEKDWDNPKYWAAFVLLDALD